MLRVFSKAIKSQVYFCLDSEQSKNEKTIWQLWNCRWKSTRKPRRLLDSPWFLQRISWSWGSIFIHVWGWSLWVFS